MMRWSVIWGLARAEARLCRRLVRYWVFLVLASLFAALSYAFIGMLFYNFSSFSATIGAMNPRYLFVGGFGMRYALLIVIGLIFLSFDIRARDTKDRIVEVLDSQPYSNLELVFGRATGIVLCTWIPPVILVLLLAAVGWGFGLTMEPLSLLSWFTLQLIPALVFMVGLTFFLTLLVRNRLVASIVLLAVFGGLLFATVRTPIWAAPSADVLGAFMAGFPSDIVPTLVTPDGWLQRGAILLAGVGFLVLAATVHPRKDDDRRAIRAAIGAGAVIVACAMLVSIVKNRVDLLDDIASWRDAHEARMDDPAPDVRAIRGTVDVDPGRRLALDLEIVVAAPPDASISTATFAFNPGLEIDAIESVSGALDFRHESGLLDVDLPSTLGPEGETTLRLRASGRPDDNFAYLDATMHPFEVRSWDGQIFLLGLAPAVFERRFVGLMPAVRWLPTSGPAIGADGFGDRPVDFFDLDLEVGVPEGWSAVVAGRRQDAADGRQRFAPTVPVPPVALIAAEYERRAVEIDGVVTEALLYHTHTGAFDVFAESSEPLVEWLDEHLQEAADFGLAYPLDQLSLVEVPQLLRGFGGGWRMPSTMAPPGSVLVRETGFPTVRFEVPFEDRDDFEDVEGGVAQAKLDRLRMFFQNDFTGSNPFVGASHGFFDHQTDGIGKEGLPLDHVFAELSARLVSDSHDYFSVYILDSGMQAIIGQVIQRYFSNRQQLEVVDALIDVAASRPAVWDRLLTVSLADLDPTEDPKESVDVLALKGGAMARSMLDELGRETSGRFLSALLERTRGRAYTREDVVAAGADVGVDLVPWLDTWLEQTALPGFKAPRVEVFRLPDADDGSPRYQTLVTVANGEDVAGLVRVEVAAGTGEDRWAGEGPFQVAPEGAIDVGVVTSKTPAEARVEPYLSLNRGAFNVPIATAVDEEKIREVEPLRGARASSWEPTPDERVTIDDLDDGFSVLEGDGGGGLRLTGRKQDDVETDGGIPVHGQGRVGRDFVRLEMDSAWGRYRHTVAAARPGGDGQAAAFEAELERSGPWTLEIHVPPGADGRPTFAALIGTWTLRIVDPSGTNEATLDAENGVSGWNTIGTFELAAGTTRVELRGADGDSLVLADAVRWTPPRTSDVASGARP